MSGGRSAGRLSSDSETVEAAIAAHKKFVLRQPGGLRARLSNLDLARYNFSDRILTEADFTGSSLVAASAQRANFERATLYCCDLRDADLQHANLRNADLRGTTLRGAKLAFADLDGADFRAARMILSGAESMAFVNRNRLRQTDEADATKTAEGVDFRNCSMKGASLKGANLKGADFSDALLQGAKFSGAVLSNVTFANAVLTGVNMYDLKVPASALKGAITEPTPEAMAKAAELRQRVISHRLWIESRTAQGAAAILDDQDIRPLQAILQKALLTAVSARRVVAVGMSFAGAQLQGAQFDGADLRDCNFTGADIRGASFRGAKIAHARFQRANITPLKLGDGRDHPTDFSGTDMSPDQLADRRTA
jgi:uncharacterized protein YjbI with pentapeptide repeats